MHLIRVTSIQAPNADPICRRISKYLGERLGIPSEYIEMASWQERERLLDAGEVQVGWICGLPYIWKADRERSQIELLAAPVMQAERYQDRPVYFSDVIVHRESAFTSFMDLRGASWAYNEPHSHSGYNITRYHLASLGENTGFFGKIVEAGSHQAALEMILRRQINASAIDSTVLETEIQLHPEIQTQFRIIAALGPSPIPPWVISTSVPSVMRQAIRDILLNMHSNPRGREILSAGQIKRFARVEDSDYDPIRRMARLAQAIEFKPTAPEGGSGESVSPATHSIDE